MGCRHAVWPASSLRPVSTLTHSGRPSPEPPHTQPHGCPSPTAHRKAHPARGRPRKRGCAGPKYGLRGLSAVVACCAGVVDVEGAVVDEPVPAESAGVPGVFDGESVVGGVAAVEGESVFDAGRVLAARVWGEESPAGADRVDGVSAHLDVDGDFEPVGGDTWCRVPPCGRVSAVVGSDRCVDLSGGWWPKRSCSFSGDRGSRSWPGRRR
jgi:hypothetical protein